MRPAPPQADPLDKATVEQVIRARQTRMRIARECSDVFAELVLVDEETGDEVENSPIHEQWHKTLDKHPRVIMWSCPELGKTGQLGIARPLWKLGCDPTLRVVVLGNTHGAAEKITRTIKELIETSPVVKAVFPHLKPGKKWTDGQFSVRREFTSRTPSVQAVGAHGSINGERIDLLIVDDLLDYENTATATARVDTETWFKRAVLSRLTGRSEVLLMSNAWHPADLLHVLARSKVWHSESYPVLMNVDDAPDGGWTEEAILEYGISVWPEKWPLHRIADALTEMTPLPFAQTMLCRARDEASSRFSEAWIQRCVQRGLPMLRQWPGSPDTICVIGTDLGVKQKQRSDRTAITVLLVHADGKHQIAYVEGGRWKGPDIVRRLGRIYDAFGGFVFVENNAAQDYLLQFLGEMRADIPLFAHHTGMNKWDRNFGIESLAVLTERGSFIIPADDQGRFEPGIAALVGDMMNYVPHQHTGDYLMSLWIAREGARKLIAAATGTGGEVGVRVI